MATVYIPALLRDLTGGRDSAVATGSSVGQIIGHLETSFPGVRERLCDGDKIRAGLAVAIDGQLATLGLLQRVGPSSEVHFLPAIAGGASKTGPGRAHRD